MSRIRAYIDTTELNLMKYPEGSHFVRILVDGTSVEQVLRYENGEFYIALNSTRPHVPATLRSHVRVITSYEEVNLISNSRFENMTDSVFRSRSGKARATIRKIHKGDVLIQYLVIEMTADSVHAWKAFRQHLLFGPTQTLAKAA